MASESETPVVRPGRTSQRASQPVELRRVATTIFALTTIIPLLLLVQSLWATGAIYETRAQVTMVVALAVAVLGFVLLDRTMDRVSRVVRTVARPESDMAPPPRVTDMVPGLGQVAEIGDLALAFSRLLSELRESTARLEDLVFKMGTLDDMVDMAARIPHIQDLLSHVLERTMRAVHARIGSIMLLDHERQALRIVASRGLPDEVAARAEVRVGEGIAGKVVEQGEPVLVEDIETDTRFARSADPKYGSGSFICMPLKVGPRIVGVVNLATKAAAGDSLATAQAFGRTDLQFLNALMTYTAYAVDNARLLDEARQAARRLTDVVEDQKLRLTVAEQQVLQAAKLSALGELVAGVAHELNNPITLVMNGVEILEEEVPASVGPTLATMRSASERARRILRGLLSFARQMPLQRESVDLVHLLDEVLTVTAADLRLAGIVVEKEVRPNLPTVWADRTQLEQVMINLVTNARQAMAEMEAGPRRLRISVERAGPNRVAIMVADTGPGIPADLLGRIFDPFVTTKGSRGTGLGLSVSYGIVREHGGSITVENQGGPGATFRVELPIGTGSSTPPAGGDRPAGT